MNTSKLIEILNWPRKKGNYFKPWYVILWCTLLLPFGALFGICFYLYVLGTSLDFRIAEQFRKEWFSLY